MPSDKLDFRNRALLFKTLEENTYDLLKDEFVCSEVGEVEIKGFGMQRLYQLDSEIASRR